MKEYPTEIIQPIGKHNPKAPCVPTKYVKEYLDIPFEHLNPTQSEFVKYLDEDETDIVVAAPTSSGKTLIAELFAARGMSLQKNLLYIAPMKALADEKYADWTSEKHTFSSKKISILTGDFQFTDAKKKELDDSDIIILTPEMFNSKCRSFQNHSWLQDAWLIVDECHLVGMIGRGDALEVGLVQYYENHPKCRCLMLSATIPNVDDFGKWLEHLSGRPSQTIIGKYRPCQLNINFHPFLDSSGKKKMFYSEIEQKRLEETVKLVQKYRHDPTLVFVGNKDFGHKLSKLLSALGINQYFHNADLDREKRQDIESKFKDGTIKVLISTTTLAWGCIPQDSFVSLNNGYEEIKYLFNHNILSEKESKIKIKNNNQYTLLDKGVSEDFYEIMLDNGQFLQATCNHEVFTKDGLKKVEELSDRDYLFVQEEVSFQKDNNFDKNFFYLLGLIAGDGHIPEKGCPIITCADDNHRDMVVNICKKIGVFYSDKKDSNGTPVVLLSKKKEFVDSLKQFIKYIDSHKRIDYNLLGLPEDKLLSIIAGLIDSDGCVESNKICFYNTSKWLLSFFSLAMRRFGIDCKCKKKKKRVSSFNGHLILSKKQCYEVNVSSKKGIIFFYNKISPFMNFPIKIEKIKEKRKKLSKHFYFPKTNDIFSLGYIGSNDDFIHKVLDFCKEPKFFSEILKKFKIRRIPIRKHVFDQFFDIKTEYLKGIVRKTYTTKDIFYNIPYGRDNVKCFLIKNGFRFNDNIAIRNITPRKNPKILSIDKIDLKKKIYDISILDCKEDSERNFFSNGIKVHNCNTPARWVIQTHTSFGLSPMHPANIHQSVGRAGRTGYSDRGDAIILAPKSKITQEKKRILGDYKVFSVLTDPDILMFHILQYVVDGHIRNADELISWYNKTLYSVQNKKPLERITAERVLSGLAARYMIKKGEEGYEATRLGEITAQMYMSPIDVSDWFRNFSKIKDINPPERATSAIVDKTDLLVSLCFSTINSFGKTTVNGELRTNPTVYITKREKMAPTVQELSIRLGKDLDNNPHIKYTAVFYNLLRGREVDSELLSYKSSILKDIDRIIQTLKLADMHCGKFSKCNGFGWGHEWDLLLNRIKYGCGADRAMASLASAPGLGKTRLEKLKSNGIKSKSDFLSPVNKEKIKKIIGPKIYSKAIDHLVKS